MALFDARWNTFPMPFPHSLAHISHFTLASLTLHLPNFFMDPSSSHAAHSQPSKSPYKANPKSKSIVPPSVAFWEDVDDEFPVSIIPIDHGTHISSSSANPLANKTLFSGFLETSQPVELDDLFNADCFVSTPIHHEKSSPFKIPTLPPKAPLSTYQ